MLRFYFEVARTAYRRQLIYRWANLAGICTNIFFSIVLSSVIIALYHARSSVGGYNLRDALSYTWVAQALIMIVLPFGWIDLMQTIRTGEVVTDLNKPCDFFLYWCSREMGRALYYLLFRGLPIYLAGLLIFHVELSASWSVWLAFPGCLALGAASGVVFRVLLNLVAFWIIEARAVITFGVVIAQICSGIYIPVVFFPSWLHALVNWLPFDGMANLPTEVFLEKPGSFTLLTTLLLQMGWLLILIVVTRSITSMATRRVVVQGG